MSARTGAGSITPISLPTPFAVGPVYAYIIREDPVTLVDSGLNLPDCRAALEQGLAAHGLSVADIRRVILTHGHLDHIGMAGWLQQDGAEVWMHLLEQGKALNQPWWSAARQEMMMLCGVPAAVQESTRQYFAAAYGLVAPLQGPVRPLADGDRIPFDGFELEALWTPGHSLGHVSLWWEQEQALFGGDLLLDGISPNPLPEPLAEGGRALVLQQFLDSLDRVAALPVRQVFPGHGPLIAYPSPIIEHYRVHHRRRLEEIRGLVPPAGVRTYDLARQVYPRVREWNIFLAVSEVWAHLELLAHRGRLRTEVDDDGALRYRPI